MFPQHHVRELLVGLAALEEGRGSMSPHVLGTSILDHEEEAREWERQRALRDNGDAGRHS